ncbi:MAG: glycosyltransferase [Clostridia bacterium]|nr:glycosyltransferase [Clostridia bacterium]
MNIGFVCSSDGIGGAEKNIKLTCEHLNKKGFSTSVILLRNCPKLKDFYEKNNIEVYSFNLVSIRSVLKDFVRLCSLLRSKKFDAIQLFGLRTNIIMRPIGKLIARTKVVTAVVSTDDWRKWYHIMLDRITAPFVDMYVSNSIAGKEAVMKREKVKESKIKVVYYGINLDSYEPLTEGEKEAARGKYGIKAQNFVISEIANLRIMKGHKLVIDAVENLVKDFDNIRVIFAGKDDSNGEIPNYIKEKRLEKYFILAGFVDDIRSLLGITDLFLLPSDWEGMPTCVLEAMSMKVPVITTKVGGIHELTGDDGGILIPKGDSKALERAIRTMLGNENTRKNCVMNGYIRAKEIFSENDTFDKLAKVFKSMP